MTQGNKFLCVDSGSAELAEIESYLKDPVAKKILQLETKVQKLSDKASVQRANSTTKASNSTKTCKDPWSHFGGKCYLYSSGIRLTWWDGLAFCRSLGANMVVPVSQNENNYIKQIARDSGEPVVWIGISDAHTEGQWLTYPDMNLVNSQFTDWGPGEPSGGAENCGNLLTVHGYRWNDSPCTTQYTVYFVKTGSSVFRNLVYIGSFLRSRAILRNV
ncbi:hypothetical protein FSP39_021724 [Pinctada imbricata]|uniref:C-type lectin domain-containing protein n=1 Tax=Pinctada imbricata TaxID=66713 RepID=A0AA89BRN9_PINIB|nr:hypothetical protein FSP39_021724 [Pinctada imbricata]